MKSQLKIVQPLNAWGATGERTYKAESSAAAEEVNGRLVLIVTQGAVSHSPGYVSPYTPATPEVVARIDLTAEERKTLAAFLSSLPQEES